MRLLIPVSLVAALLTWGCDLGVQQRSASRTVVGVSSKQVVAAAQQTFVDKGFDLAAFSTEHGFVKSDWIERPRRQLMYTVRAERMLDEDERAVKGVWTLLVEGLARDRLVSGWSDEYQTDHRVHEVLDAISAHLTDPAAKPTLRQSVRRVECKHTADCPGARHCAGGRCVAECGKDGECLGGERCDGRGRCVVAGPEPSPATAPVPTPTETAPADAGPGSNDVDGGTPEGEVAP
jgi:hypothetical protein